MKYTFKVDGLDCANCAAKLENKISKNEHITFASINYMKEKAIIESDLEEEELIKLLDQISEDMGEEAVFLSGSEEHHHDEEHEHHHEHHHDHKHDEEHEHHHHHHDHEHDEEHEHHHHHHDHDECDGSCDIKAEEEDSKKGRYVFKVEGLDCANCAAKLENKIAKNEHITFASINYMKEKAIIESDLEEEELIKLLDQISEDMGEEAVFLSGSEEHHHDEEHEHHHHHDHEHDEEHHHHHHHHDHDECDGSCDTEQDEEVSTEGRHVFKVDGLDCANCAAALEDKISKNEHITFASINYMKEKAIIESDLEEEELIKLLDQISEDMGEEAVFLKESTEEVRIHEETVNKKEIKEEEDEGKSILIRLAVAICLFILGNFLLKNGIVRTAVLLIAYLVAGYDVLLKAIRNIGKGQLFDENFLMALATVGAILLKEYPEACGVMIFYQIGEYFQDKAVEESRKSIAELMDIRPDTAHVIRNGKTQDVHPSQVKVNELIEVRPGEKIPLDGIVEKGKAQIDSKALTGESMLQNAHEGDEVLSGSVSTNAVLIVRVSKPFSQSTASKILELVEDASDYKSKSEKFITRFARIYTPAVVISALIIGLVVPLLLYGRLSYDYIYRALVFLMVSCPCALVVSIPLSYFGGLGAASKNGVIIKGSNHLETLGDIDTVVFDKTGTLTQGNFAVTSVCPAGMEKEELLQKAAYAEYYAAHPIGQSILNSYHEEIDAGRIQDFREIANRGVGLLLDGHEILAGSYKLMQESGVECAPADTYESVVYISEDGTFAGYLTISDEVREESAAALKELKNSGIEHLVMLSGDHKGIADAIAKKLGLSEAYGELLPADKVARVEEMTRNGQKVAFVGDGINDAPVLKRSDLGIAMGALGSDAAIEAADVILMQDDLRGIAKARSISVKTKKIVYQNIVFALAVKFLVLILGALGKTNMWAATFADVGVAMLCVLNALRLLKE